MLANLLSSSYPGRRRNQANWEDQSEAVARATERRHLERYHSQGLAFWLDRVKQNGRSNVRVLDLKPINPSNFEFLIQHGLQVSTAGLTAESPELDSSEQLIGRLSGLFCQRSFDAILAWDLLLHIATPIRDDLTRWLSKHSSTKAPLLMLAGAMPDGRIPSATYRIGDGGEVTWDTKTTDGEHLAPNLHKGCVGFSMARKFLLRHGPTELVMQSESLEQ